MNDEQKLEKALKVLQTRGMRVETRLEWYEGRHPSQLGSKAWNDSYRALVGGIRDNQCKLVVDTTAEAVIPVGVEISGGTAYEQVIAQWISDRFVDEGERLAAVVKMAEAAGEQTTVSADYDSEGEVAFYLLDPRACYVHQDAAGGYLWAVHFWRSDEDAPTQATIYDRTETALYGSDAKDALPAAGAFTEKDRNPNVFGELMLACVDKRGSVIDEVAPQNATLNKSLQTQAVVGEAYALPLRIYLGIETYNPDTGEVNAVIPQMNPATGSRDVSIPTVVDAEGSDRQIVQLTSPSPGEYLAEQEAARVAIARLANIPAFMLQVGGAQPASGDALEIAFLPYLAARAANIRSYGPFWNRVARLAVRRYLYKLTGVPMDAPAGLKAKFGEVSTSTQTNRMAEFTAAINAGMTLSDALVEFLGWDREVADLAEKNSDASAQAKADRAAAQFNAGMLGGADGADTTGGL